MTNLRHISDFPADHVFCDGTGAPMPEAECCATCFSAYPEGDTCRTCEQAEDEAAAAHDEKLTRIYGYVGGVIIACALLAALWRASL